MRAATVRRGLNRSTPILLRVDVDAAPSQVQRGDIRTADRQPLERSIPFPHGTLFTSIAAFNLM